MIGLCKTWLKLNDGLPLNEAYSPDYTIPMLFELLNSFALIYQRIFNLLAKHDIKIN